MSAGSVQELQEAALRRRASEEGRAAGWIYYLAVRRDWARLEEWGRRIAPEDTAGRLVHDLVGMERAPERAEGLAERVAKSDDPWTHYTLAKALLRQGRLKEALRVAYARLERDRHDVGPLNLVAKYLVARGEGPLAQDVVRRIERLNPRQEDIAALGALASQGQPLPYALNLDPLPQLEKVAFYLPVYNVERYIRAAIEGILAQNYPIAEVLVIDDGSPDGSIAIAEEYPVRIVRHESNKGLAAARNTAFRHATSRFVGAVDTDAWPGEDFTKLVLMEFESADARMCGAGGRLVEANQTEPADRWRAKYLAQQQGPLRLCTPEGLFGSNTIFLREAVLDAGGYDEKYRTNAEDVGICRALRGAGRWFFYTPYAVAYHGRTDTVASVLRTMWNWAYPGKLEAEVYDNPIYVLLSLQRLVEAVDSFFQNDLRLGHDDSLYIDVLCLFYLGFLDLKMGVEHGALSGAEARFLKEGMLQALDALERRGATGLAARVQAETEGLLPEGCGGGADGVREDLPGWLREFQAGLRRVYEQVPVERLMRGMRGMGGGVFERR